MQGATVCVYSACGRVHQHTTGSIASARDAPRGAWLRRVLGAFMSAGRATVRKRLAAVEAPVGLLAGVGPLVRRNGALVTEALLSLKRLGHMEQA